MRRVCYTFNASIGSSNRHPWITWRTFAPADVAGLYTPSVLFTNDDGTPVPDGYAELQRGTHLPVSNEERRAVALALPPDGTRLRALVHQHRQDPDWFVWVAPLTETAATAREHWLAAVDDAIGTEHSHIVLIPVDDRWEVHVGLGSRQRHVHRNVIGLTRREAVRAGVGPKGGRFTDRGTALREAISVIQRLRAEAVQSLESALAGWSREAVDARLNPSREMRIGRGWQPLRLKVQVYELVLPAARRSDWHDDRRILVEEIAVDGLPDARVEAPVCTESAAA